MRWGADFLVSLHLKWNRRGGSHGVSSIHRRPKVWVGVSAVFLPDNGFFSDSAIEAAPKTGLWTPPRSVFCPKIKYSCVVLKHHRAAIVLDFAMVVHLEGEGLVRVDFVCLLTFLSNVTF